ncbi:MAG: Ran-interacting Mog1 family protein [archaeon]|nr:Ran-interacting Mog1 family protein [archaeon]
MASLDDATHQIVFTITKPGEMRELWGGAVTVRLPGGYIDSSDCRPLPDNQEVFVHMTTDQSFIFELLEPVDAADYGALGKAHLMSVLDDNEADDPQHFRVLEVAQLTPAHLPSLGTSEFMACHVRAEMLVSKFKEQARNHVQLSLIAIRLKNHATDLVISYHHPAQLNPDSSSADSAAPDAGWADTLIPVVKSLAIRDWHLFG